jgi:hypothetical protein
MNLTERKKWLDVTVWLTPISSISIESNGREFVSAVVAMLPALPAREQLTCVEPKGRLIILL